MNEKDLVDYFVFGVKLASIIPIGVGFCAAKKYYDTRFERKIRQYVSEFTENEDNLTFELALNLYSKFENIPNFDEDFLEKDLGIESIIKKLNNVIYSSTEPVDKSYF